MPQQTKPINWKHIVGGLAIAGTGYVLYQTYKSHRMEELIDALCKNIKKACEENTDTEKANNKIAMECLDNFNFNLKSELFRYRGTTLFGKELSSQSEPYLEKKLKEMKELKITTYYKESDSMIDGKPWTTYAYGFRNI